MSRVFKDWRTAMMTRRTRVKRVAAGASGVAAGAEVVADEAVADEAVAG